MRPFAIIFRRELKYLFRSLTAWVTLSVFLFLAGYFFHNIFKRYNYLSYQMARSGDFGMPLNLTDDVMRPLLGDLSLILLILLPLLTMRLLAEERKQGTFELLLTYPIGDLPAVAGKYAAALATWGIMLAGTVACPVLLAVYADPEPGPIVTGYLGLFLMGGTFIAIGTFFSSLTDNQLVAGVSAFGAGLFFLVIGWTVPFAGPTAAKVISQFSLLYHLESFTKGVIVLQDVTYYLLMSAFFLFLTLKSLESARWRN
ncbi:MAG: ABC transporter permease subunit [Candidatus Krumholzibacteriota bacterium]|nr:ABC transporter permease subunit [Candidatus Krumholzibacteriota bacterium]